MPKMLYNETEYGDSILPRGVLLWENPNPTAEFPAQDIVLSSNDYSYLLICCQVDYKYDLLKSSEFIFNRKGTRISSIKNGILYYRDFILSTETVLNASSAKNTSSSSPTTTEIVPIYIYGFKIQKNTSLKWRNKNMPCLMRNGLNYTGGGGGGTTVLPPDEAERRSTIIELTQEEYDALGDGKLTDDALYLIKDGVPSVLDNCVLLWENPDTAVDFPEQDITLASDDYDILEVFFYAGSKLKYLISARCLKGNNTRLETTIFLNGPGVSIGRIMLFKSSTLYHVNGGLYNNTNADNSYAIPYRIYGYKISGKYPSDQNPTIDPAGAYSYDETHIGTWVDGKPLYRKMIFKDGLANGEGTTNGENANIPTELSNIEVGYVNIAHSYFLYGNNNDDIYYSFINVPNLPVVIYRKESNIIQLVCKTNLSTYRAMICFEYTKTTDIAGG